MFNFLTFEYSKIIFFYFFFIVLDDLAVDVILSDLPFKKSCASTLSCLSYICCFKNRLFSCGFL